MSKVFKKVVFAVLAALLPAACASSGPVSDGTWSSAEVQQVCGLNFFGFP